MYFRQILDAKLAQYSYLIGCEHSGEAIIIDPLRDIDRYYKLAVAEKLKITAAVDTHIHADYVSGLREFGEEGVNVFASDEGGPQWKYEWLKAGDYSSRLLYDGDSFSVGNINFDVCHTPGHTPESISFLVTDAENATKPMGILTGDFVFVGDVGRPDLLETAAGKQGATKPAAKTLFQSVQSFKSLPAYLQVWPGHGAGSACGKAMGSVPESTVGYELQFSTAFKASKSESQFVDYILDGQPEPPLYFSRMKNINKQGPPVLGALPEARKVPIEVMMNAKGTVVDTRDKHQFMKRHLKGSLMASLDKNFSTIAGSYIDSETDIYLVVDETKLESTVRDLICVGLDNIKGYATLEDLDRWEGRVAQIEAVDFDDVNRLRKNEGAQVLDVRKATEYARDHVPASKNIAHTRLAAHLDELPKDKHLLVHCAGGQRAAYASSLLAREGFNVKWVNDNFSNWQKNG